MRAILIAERKRLKHTQRTMAKALGITKQHYQRLELGKSSGSVRIWSELSAMAGKPINELLELAKEACDARTESV